MIFFTDANTSNNIILNNGSIEKVWTCKYLGITTDDELNFCSHNKEHSTVSHLLTQPHRNATTEMKNNTFYKKTTHNLQKYTLKRWDHKHTGWTWDRSVITFMWISKYSIMKIGDRVFRDDEYYNYYYNYYTRLMALCPGLPGWASTRKVKPVCFYWSKRQWVAVASAGPYKNLHLTPGR